MALAIAISTLSFFGLHFLYLHLLSAGFIQNEVSATFVPFVSVITCLVLSCICHSDLDRSSAQSFPLQPLAVEFC